MTLTEFYKWLENPDNPRDTKIVHMRIRYSFENENEWDYLKVIMHFTMSSDQEHYMGAPSDYEWDWDWNEGQEIVEILGCVNIYDLDIPNFDEENANFMDLDFKKTCDAFPVQYDVMRKGKQVAYIRLRWGELTVTCPNEDGELIYLTKIGDKNTGEFESAEQRAYYLRLIEKRIAKWVRNHGQK